MSVIPLPTSSSPLNLRLHPELAHGGYSCLSPLYKSSHSGCKEPFPVRRGGLAGREPERKSGLVVLALSLPLGSILPHFRAAFLSVSSLAS